MTPSSASPSSTRAGAVGLSFRLVSRKNWQSAVEPALATLSERAGRGLLRHRARIGPWVVEFVGDAVAPRDYFAQHWPAANKDETPDGYLYQFRTSPGDLATTAARDAIEPRSTPSPESIPGDRAPGLEPALVLCAENGRVLLTSSHRYGETYAACQLLVRHLAARGASSIPGAGKHVRREPVLILNAACAEYQPVAGSTRTVALVGAPRSGKSTHAYALTLAHTDNGVLADDLVCIHPTTAIANRIESRFWWPAALARSFPHLAAYLATSPGESIEFDERLRSALREYRDGADLARAIDDGSFPDDQFTALAELLRERSNGGRMLIAPQSLLQDQWLAQAQLTDLVRLSLDTTSRAILQPADPADLVTQSLSDLGDRRLPGGPLPGTAVFEERLGELAACSTVAPVMLNTRLPPCATQFCLRHYLDGRSDRIVLLDPGDDGSGSLPVAMGVARRRTSGEVEGVAAWSFCHGMRRVELLSFERSGARIECVAFDMLAEGYAQVRSVWPGQVADFFSRHAPLGVHGLFAEMRNGSRFKFQISDFKFQISK